MTINDKLTPPLSFTDETFDQDATLTYHLSIQLGFDEFSFCVLDISRNKYLALTHYNFQRIRNENQLNTAVSTIFKETDLLNKSYKTVSVSVINNKSTLVPNPLFAHEKLSDYLKFNSEFEIGFNITTDTLKTLDTRNVYAVSQGLEKTIKKYFSSAKIIHHSSSLLEGLLTNYKNISERNFFVNVRTTSFDAVLMEGKKLIFYNSFNYQTNEDFVYYLLFVCEQLKLNPENQKLILLGNIEKNSNLYALLYKYIRQIQFIEQNSSFEYSYHFNEIPRHKFYHLLNQYLSN